VRIEWKGKYRIGEPVIDAQHREWFAKVNRFLEADGKEALKRCEAEMYAYTHEHFKHEEFVMRSVHYPDIANHIRLHDALVERLHEISRQIENDTLDRAMWESFLGDWLLNHIRLVDSKLATYIHKYASC
jgi:hemerythrin-like metal-binding protein